MIAPKEKARERRQRSRASAKNAEFLDAPNIAQAQLLPTTYANKNLRERHRLAVIDRLLARALVCVFFDLPYSTEIEAARQLAGHMERRATP